MPPLPSPPPATIFKTQNNKRFTAAKRPGLGGLPPTGRDVVLQHKSFSTFVESDVQTTWKQNNQSQFGSFWKRFNSFCTFVTEMRRSLKVQIQLTVKPPPSPTTSRCRLHNKPRPLHRGNFDCAVWRNILLLWLQWQKNTHYIHQVARRCSEKKKNKSKPNTE